MQYQLASGRQADLSNVARKEVDKPEEVATHDGLASATQHIVAAASQGTFIFHSAKVALCPPPRLCHAFALRVCRNKLSISVCQMKLSTLLLIVRLSLALRSVERWLDCLLQAMPP